jgi:hypothetical protein
VPGTINFTACPSLRAVLRAAVPALLLSGLCLIPFLNKAYTIDDPFFLLQARQILKAPLHPMAFELCWFGKDACDVVATAAPNMSLGGYALTPLMLAGGAEWLGHLQQMLVLWAGILATVSLALRLGLGPRAAVYSGLILASLPPVLLMATTVMPDTLAMSLGAIGVERLVAWKIERKWWQAAAGALALGCAPFGRPHMAFLIPVVALLMREDGRILDWKSWLRIPLRLWMPLVLAAAIFVALVKITSELSAGLAPPAWMESLANVPGNLRTYLAYWAILTPLAAAWFALQIKSLRYRWLWLLPVAVIIVWKVILAPSPTWMPVARMLGSVALADILLCALWNRNHFQISMGAWLLIGLPTAVHLHMPPKYLAASGPAIALLIAVLAVRLAPFLQIAAIAVIVSVSAVFSVMLLRADADFANVGRKAAAELIAPRIQSGERVWFSGQWGFYWYALRAGALPSNPSGPQPRPGEVMVLGRLEGGDVILSRFPRRTLLERRRFFGHGGRTMSPEHGVSFHSNGMGPLPYAWIPGELNRYDVWRVEP